MGTAALGCPGERSSPAAGSTTTPDLGHSFRRKAETSSPTSVPILKSKSCRASLRWTAEGGCPHIPRFSIALMPQAFYRRQLPHLQYDERQHFLTFCTHKRWTLPQCVRQTVLQCSLHDNGHKFDLRVAVVMPDHVHMIFMPLIDQQTSEVFSLAKIMDAIKGASAHKVNRSLGRTGKVWQAESFDHVLRSSESLDAKISYLLDNPVRAGFVDRWQNYRWLWKKPFVNPFAPEKCN